MLNALPPSFWKRVSVSAIENSSSVGVKDSASVACPSACSRASSGSSGRGFMLRLQLKLPARPGEEACPHWCPIPGRRQVDPRLPVQSGSKANATAAALSISTTSYGLQFLASSWPSWGCPQFPPGLAGGVPNILLAFLGESPMSLWLSWGADSNGSPMAGLMPGSHTQQCRRQLPLASFLEPTALQDVFPA